jgi:hypothetical protein|tara:strand:- start:1289 stop:1693 length:405 start_codon:yes stop_codon:yes gene_type:complete
MTTEEMIPMDKLAKIYLKIRTRVQLLTQEYEKEKAGLEAQKAEVANAMRDQMKALGSKSVKTEYGTVMLGVKTRYSTQDWDAFKDFCISNNTIDLLERRIAQRNMAKWLEENPEDVPPGLNSDSEYEVTVRKPS